MEKAKAHGRQTHAKSKGRDKKAKKHHAPKQTFMAGEYQALNGRATTKSIININGQCKMGKAMPGKSYFARDDDDDGNNDADAIRKLQLMYREKAHQWYGTGGHTGADDKAANTAHKSRGKSKKPAPRSSLDLEMEDAPLLGFIHGIPDDMQEFFKEAHDLPCVQKLNLGHHEDLTIEDVAELFEALNPEYDDSDGTLDLDKIHVLLTHMLEPPCSEDEVEALLKPFPQKGLHDWTGVQVTIREIFNAFTRGPQVKEFVRLRKLHHRDIKRDDLVEHLDEVVDQNDYFLTLPVTVVNLFVFVLFVVGHLRIESRTRLEASMESFINGRGLEENTESNSFENEVVDIDSFWSYLIETGLNGPFGLCRNSTVNDQWQQCTIAHRNVLLGDVRLVQRKFDGAESSNWLLHTSAGIAHLAQNPNQYKEAAKAAATALQGMGGDHPEIHENELTFSTYNEHARMFAVTSISIFLGKFGDVRQRINADSVSVEPYHFWWLYIVDLMFFSGAVMITVAEGLNMVAASRLGFEEFKDYWEFWNIVDWIGITASLFTTLFWINLAIAMNSSVLQELINKDFMLDCDVMATMSSARSEEILEQTSKVRTAYLLLQTTCAIHTIILIAKFFKAFNCNPRLKVVQDTFSNMLTDFVHYLLVFSTLFLAMILIAHILFGQDVVEFASLTSSMNTGFMALMTEYAWYADISPQSHRSQLPSGKNTWWLFLWYFLFMVLIGMVLLNMLIALVLENYLVVKAGLQDRDTTVPAIWTQVAHYRQFLKDTSGFVPLRNLLLDLENDYDPAHPEPIVSAHSLMQCWPAVSAEQAIWLMCLLEEKSRIRQEQLDLEDDETQHTKIEEEYGNKLQGLVRVLLNADESLEVEEVKPVQGKGQQGKYDNGDAHLSKREKAINLIGKTLEEVQVAMSKLRRDQDNLTQRLDQFNDNTFRATSTSASRKPGIKAVRTVAKVIKKSAPSRNGSSADSTPSPTTARKWKHKGKKKTPSPPA